MAAAARAVFVAVVVANPVGQVAVDGLVATLGGDVKERVAAEEHLAASRERRVGVEDLAGLILVEHAAAGHFVDHGRALPVVVEALATGNLLGRERNVEIDS